METTRDTADDAGFAQRLLEGLREAVAWKRGELALETVTVEAKVGRQTQP